MHFRTFDEANAEMGLKIKNAERKHTKILIDTKTKKSMATKKLSLLRLDEEMVDVVGYQYIWRAQLLGGAANPWNSGSIFMLTLNELEAALYNRESQIPWDEIEAGLDRSKCWSKSVE